ncbi:helix-turn-helix domain-containing protein [Streptomyces sp. NPDC050085]|uniref:helix-turn-helix domain-containing protein n=1 Tax=Streptomyces sp. NPDC050085 TaxID=3365600 RepID=UPI003788D0CA
MNAPETGTSPDRWLTRQRVNDAHTLLETTDLSVDRIATEVGFATRNSLLPAAPACHCEPAATRAAVIGSSSVISASSSAGARAS